MKRSYLFALSVMFISVTSMLCSCTENGYDEGRNEPMSFTAAISGRGQTRATVDTARTAGSTLIVHVAEPSSVAIGSVNKTTRASTPDGVWPNGGANVAVQITGNSNTAQYTIANGKMTSGSPFYWMDKNSVTVTSWYPYSVSMPASWSVKGDQSTAGATDYAASDLLYASTPFTYGGSNNTITYAHATAKVVINIVKANDVTSASSVSSVTIGTANSQIDLSGTVNSGAITATTSTIGYIKPYQTTPANATNYVATYSALVIPQDVSGKQFIAVTVGANTYYYKPTSMVLQGGNEYDYNVTIPPSTNSPLTPGKYYLLDNGAVSTLPIPSGRTAIAVVFSNRIGPEEQAKGYHNYAIALKDAGTGISWGPYPGTTSLTDRQTEAAYYSDLSSGYVGTTTYGMASNTYPAFLAAKNYTNTVAAPTTIANSGWYLPSMGQWWDVIANLGKVDMSYYKNSTSDATWGINISTVTSNVNNYFTAVGGTALYTDNWYWSSTDYNDSSAGIIDFPPSYVYISYYGKPNNYHIRAIISF